MKKILGTIFIVFLMGSVACAPEMEAEFHEDGSAVEYVESEARKAKARKAEAKPDVAKLVCVSDARGGFDHCPAEASLETYDESGADGPGDVYFLGNKGVPKCCSGGGGGTCWRDAAGGCGHCNCGGVVK